MPIGFVCDLDATPTSRYVAVYANIVTCAVSGNALRAYM